MNNPEYQVLFDDLPYIPFGRMHEFRKRALGLLSRFDADQIKSISANIDEMVDRYFYIERERWIQQKLEKGGDIWGYLAAEHHDEHHLRALTESPPSYLSVNELDFPSERNTSVLEALEQAILFADTEEADSTQAHEFLAVLALRDMENMVRDFHSRSKIPSARTPEINLRVAANSMIDIVEMICRSEELRREARSHKSFQSIYRTQVEKRAAEMADERAEALAAERVRNRHGDAARRGHELRNGDNKERLLKEWEDYEVAQIAAMNKPNRSEFARKAVNSGKYPVLEGAIKKWIKEWAEQRKSHL